MRRPAKQPIDVSKALFMDLAFLLIAALVLLVREPAMQIPPEPRDRDDRTIPIRLTSRQIAAVVEVSELEGQTIELMLYGDGTLKTWAQDSELQTVSLEELPARLQNLRHPRFVLLRVDGALDYQKVAEVRERLTDLQEQNVVHEILEMVRNDGES